MDITPQPVQVRLHLVIVIGFATVVGAWFFGIPGGGEFVVLAWTAGLLTRLLAAGWSGPAAFVVGIVLGIVVLAMAGGIGGLVALAVAFLLVPAAHGWLVAWTALRIARLRGASIRDAVTLVSVAIVLLSVLGAIWLGAELAAEWATSPA